MRALVNCQMSQLREALFALIALVRPLTAVHSLVARERRQICKTKRAFLDFVGLLARVDSHVPHELGRTSKGLSAYIAFVRVCKPWLTIIPGVLLASTTITFLVLLRSGDPSSPKSTTPFLDVLSAESTWSSSKSICPLPVRDMTPRKHKNGRK